VVELAGDVIGGQVELAVGRPIEDVQVNPVRVCGVARRPDAGYAE
jgi:hypothetical protein